MAHRLLVLGDNHGDTESLRRVLGDVGDERFDLAIHVGDFTRAWRTGRRLDDEARGKEVGVEQLREVEPLLADLDDRARHGLLWVWGNQDYFGDLEYDLSAGTEIPDDGHLEVDGLRFTNSLEHVREDSVLVTHMEYWRLLDHFEGRAHFCGNTHRGRHRGRRLNSAFLQVTDPETDRTTYGGYFVVDLDASDEMEVEMRPIGDLERRECDVHGERGVQFQPPFRGCMYCDDSRILWRELSASAFYGLTGGAEGESVSLAAVVEYAAGLWNDPPSGLREDFRAYLDDVDDDRYAPLTRTEDGALALAEKSYAY